MPVEIIGEAGTPGAEREWIDAENWKRPPLENRVLFRGVNCLVDLELLRTGSHLTGLLRW